MIEFRIVLEGQPHTFLDGLAWYERGVAVASAKLQYREGSVGHGGMWYGGDWQDVPAVKE
jgi:hypothetical protein